MMTVENSMTERSTQGFCTCNVAQITTYSRSSYQVTVMTFTKEFSLGVTILPFEFNGWSELFGLSVVANGRGYNYRTFSRSSFSCTQRTHTNVSRKRHDSEKLSTLLFLCEGNLPVTDGFPHKRSECGDLMFSLLLAWSVCWTNIRVATGVRRHGARVMSMSRYCKTHHSFPTARWIM